MTSYYSGFYPSELAGGAKGSAAFLGATTTTIVYLYRRSATVLTDLDKPNGNTVYTFATANMDISLVTNGWSKTIPSGTTTLYIVAATATGIDPTDIIAGAEWSSPVVFSATGLNNATIFLFQRSNTSTLPTRPATTLTYTFATGILSGTLGSWTQSAPDSSLGKYLFVTTATAINSDPTDSIINTEWAIVRVLAENGTMGYTAYLTNETHTLPATFDGTISNYTGATGQFKIYLDGVGDISSSFTLATVAGANAQGLVIAYSSNTYTISGGFDSAETVATITIRATGSGTYSGVVLDKVFSLSKSKAGVDGTPAKLLSILIDRQLITLNSEGQLSPTPQNINLTANKQGTNATVNWTIQDTVGNVLTPSSYLNNTAGDTTLMTGANFLSAILVNGTEGLIITATLTDGDVYTDKVTIMRVKTAANGINGLDGAPATSAYLTNEAQSLFAYANGNVVSFSTANGLFKIISGTTDVTSTGTSFSATASGCTGTINTAVGVPVAGQPIGYYRVTAMSADTATLTLSATHSGTTFTKIYSLSKTRGGYEIVATLPATDLFEGRVVFLTTDDKLYRYTGVAWVTSVPATDISGTLIDAQISALAASKVTGQLSDTQLLEISAAKVTGQIVGTQITDGAISTAKIAANSITSNQIAANTITAADIAASTITATEIASATITAAKIAASTITSNQIAADTITSNNIAANAITSTELATNAVTADKITAGAITAGKIAAASITSIDIAANSITASNINANGLSIKDTNGNIILSAGGAVNFANLTTSFPGATNTASVSNSNIAINASGKITGIGTGVDTTVANSQIKVTGGAITGIGAGSGAYIASNLEESSSWVPGIGPPWVVNGTAGENSIVWDVGPKGATVPVWRCTSNGDGEADGGWNHNNAFTIYPSKTYRFMVPVKFTTISGSPGYAYWGVDGNTVCNLNTTTLNDNPYFHAVARNTFATNRWYLMIGYVYPAGTTGASNTGAYVYDMTTGAIVASGSNFTWAATATLSGTRAYQYYTAGGNVQVFGQPVVEVVDGSESSINELLQASAIFNQNITISSGAISGIGTGSGTEVANSTTEARQGRFQWQTDQYRTTSAINSGGTLPSYSLVNQSLLIKSVLVPNTSTSFTFSDDNYFGVASASVFSPNAWTWSLTVSHDDAGRIYINGQSIYLNQIGSYATSINFPAGWSTIELLWAEQVGGDFFSISQAISSKTEITDMWAGANLIGLVSAAAAMSTWTGVSGAGKPEDSATVGAVAGTNLKRSNGVVVSDGQVLNESQQWSQVGGAGKPEDSATVGAVAGSNLKSSGGTVLSDTAIITSQGTAASIVNQAATATSSDFSIVTGATKPANNATVGATFGVNVSGQITSATASTYIANAAIGSALIGSIALVGTDNFSVKSGLSGQRMEINAQAIKIYDASNVLRVRIGNLTV